MVDPQMVDEVGEYIFVIVSCVEVDFVTSVCAPSNTFKITIIDSCLLTQITQIVTMPIYSVMQAAQLSGDIMNLYDEMTDWSGMSGWPWTDTVSLQTFTPNKCGYIVFDLVRISSDAREGLVRLEDDEWNDMNDWIVFEPTLLDPPGIYFYALRGRLYYGVDDTLVDTKEEAFQVVIDNCLSDLDLSLVSIPMIENVWYSDERKFDITYILQQVVPSVECGWPYSFELFQLVDDGFGFLMDAPIPGEITFINVEGATPYIALKIEKCSPIGVDTPDPMCNGGLTPFQMDWTLKMKIDIV